MQELNKKLAEWAGFIQSETAMELGKCAGHYFYRQPDGGTCLDIELPNFTESLDACFEWLVPKLDEIGEHYLVFQRAVWNQPTPKSVTISFVSGRDRDYEGQDETYALALCLAIEKLIGEK